MEAKGRCDGWMDSVLIQQPDTVPGGSRGSRQLDRCTTNRIFFQRSFLSLAG